MRHKQVHSFIFLFMLGLSFLSPAVSGRAAGLFQEDISTARARALLERMRPEERVGQLFLVTFSGTAVDEASQIYDLIAKHHVGGVVMLASNDNYVAAPDAVRSANQLIAQLQKIEWQASQTPTTDAVTGEQFQYLYTPLFVGISQGGDGYPNDQILSGLTPLPDLMAIGATWDTSMAQRVGQVSGQELSAVGFNLYFGPSLDVLESPEISEVNGLGADVFGGDPFWVGAMGQAYITGLHDGSNGRLIVVAEHFPGRGSADRPAGGEPATVRKSLEQLKQIELAPFFAVTGNAPTTQSTTDGLLVSPIRYQGFQGNIRTTTAPISFDPQNFAQIMALPALATWRQNGGLTVSDDLGSQTVLSYYEPTGPFVARFVARDALLAGNDLLYMGNIKSSDAPDTYTTVVRTIDFFTQKYQDDPAFAKRVDEAAVRILAAKYRLYGTFNLGNAVPPTESFTSVGQSTAVTFDVASRSATLISPDVIDLVTVLPSPPAMTDHLLFLTDTRPGRQCSTCVDEPMLAVDALQNAILRLYGPQGTGQVIRGRLVSYSFDDLSSILEGGGGYLELEGNLSQADWVIISMLDSEPNQAYTTTLRRFLSERQDLLRDKKVVVFAFNAPYYLDSTDISKLTAYYGLYSKSSPFVDVAARLLFRELSPAGSLPVSVPGIGYDLLSATAPDPKQVIELSLDLPSTSTPGVATPLEPTATPLFRVGDTVSVRTGVILDHNQHPVPDGTGVRFTLNLSGDVGVIQEIDAITTQGVAQASFSIERGGLLEIRATSDPAMTSVVLQLGISGEGTSVTVISPTLAPGELTPTPAVALTPDESGATSFLRGSPGLGGWFVMLILLGGCGYLTYWLGGRFFSTRWGIRWTICEMLGGLLTYNYIALGLPGGGVWIRAYGLLGIVGVILVGVLVGLVAGLIWARAVNELRTQ